jgi:hypothetical protein
MDTEDIFGVFFGILLFAVIVLLIGMFFAVPTIEDKRFYEGQAAQICDRRIEAYYKKGEDQYTVCSDGTIHKLFKRED